MTPSERWPALLLQLEADDWTRAADLARALGVSKRTVYRDVHGLMEAGVPLQGVPGKGYRVPEDYMLEPIRLTTDEAVMLVLGCAHAAQNVDGRYRAAAQAAQHKIAEALPADDQERVLALKGSMHLVPPSVFGTPTEDVLLRRVRRALLEQRTIVATVTEPSGVTADRRINPYGLVQKGSTWHIVGYGHDRRRVIHLRLPEVNELELTDATFDRPASYQTPPESPTAVPDRHVRLVFAAEVAASVQVPASVHVADREEMPDGRLLLTVKVYHELEVLSWLLSWGAHVQVLEPRALRERLAAEAQAVADQYEAVPTLLD